MRRLVEGIRKVLDRKLGAFLPATRHSRTTRQARIVALTHSPQTKLAFRLAAFREDLPFAIAISLEHALDLMGRYPVIALMYDNDSCEADWRRLCALAVDSGIGFHLIVRAASDDLFLSVISAGGAGLMAKPLTTEQLSSAVQLSRSFSETRLTSAEIW